MKTEKVYMKFNNGYQHKITILKDPILGYKYLGISQKEIKSKEEAKNEYKLRKRTKKVREL